MSLRSVLAAAASLFLAAACAPTFEVRHELAKGQPVWEATRFTGKRTPPASVDPNECPSLFLLLRQVEPGHRALSDPQGKGMRLFGEQPGAIVPALELAENPLPQALSSLPFTKAMTGALVAGYLKQPMGEVKVSAKDVKTFAKELARTNLALLQDRKNDSDPESAKRLQRLRAFHSRQPRVSIEAFLVEYYTAYYNGNFVDRVGGKLSRPSIGLKLTNELIAGALHVGLEAISDWVIVACPNIKAPVVWSHAKPEVEWHTADGNRPTLVRITQKLQMLDPDADPPTAYPRVVETLKDPGTAGITKAKLDAVRLAAGYASDVAGFVSDLVLRTIGAVELGFIVLGKLSIGDNDTFSKLVQTGFDWLFQRGTEIVMATNLYDDTTWRLVASQRGSPGHHARGVEE